LIIRSSFSIGVSFFLHSKKRGNFTLARLYS
jgi:hypothetical protein